MNLIQDGRITLGADTEVPEGVTWLGCKVLVGPGVTLTVNGAVINCFVQFSDDDVVLALEGCGEFSFNYVLVDPPKEETHNG